MQNELEKAQGLRLDTGLEIFAIVHLEILVAGILEPEKNI
jgi:hypothetical protein